MLRLVFSHSEFSYCHHKIFIDLICLLPLKKYEIFSISIFGIDFDKNWFPDGCLERNSLRKKYAYHCLEHVYMRPEVNSNGLRFHFGVKFHFGVR